MRRAFVLLCAMSLSGGCVAVPRIALPAAQPTFDPLSFFGGASVGEARLRKIFSSTTDVQVTSLGHMEGETLVLDQTIMEDGKKPHRRQWRIHRTERNSYAGTLSDATGPVTLETTGNRLHIAFTMRGGFRAEQWLWLAPDGRSARNLLVVRKFGFPLARLEERIERR